MNTELTIPDALDVVTDSSRSLEDRAPAYAILRRIRLQIDRALRPVGQEIQAAMAAADAREWGPIRLAWKAIDPKYVCNDPDNWGDAGVQDDLAAWAGDGRYASPDGTPWIRSIPAHHEVDTAVLGAAVASGDPAARDLYRLLNDKGYRTEQGRAATLTVAEAPKEKAA